MDEIEERSYEWQESCLEELKRQQNRFGTVSSEYLHLQSCAHCFEQTLQELKAAHGRLDAIQALTEQVRRRF